MVDLPPPLFDRSPNAREKRQPGTVYALSGEDGFIYYGQVGPGKGVVGFFKYRSSHVERTLDVVSKPLMCRLPIVLGSLGASLREGYAIILGRFEMHPGFVEPRILVQSPVGTNNVIVHVIKDGSGEHSNEQRSWKTRIDDPEIQNYEIATTGYDAVYHLPQRLKADFGAETADWHIGGPVWRERKVNEERARRFPDTLGHRLPTD